MQGVEIVIMHTYAIMKTDDQAITNKYKTHKQQLGHLQPRYLEIFEYRVGLADGTPHSQREAGEKFGVTGNRIRQIEERVKYELEQLDSKDALYQCPECGFKYKEKEWADKCEAWCREHHSCNIEITAHAIKEGQ